MPSEKKPYIRGGQIVYDSTPEEREAARRTRFPGTGMRLDGQPVAPAPVGPTAVSPMFMPRRVGDDDLALQTVSSGGPPPPPPPGDGSAVRFSLALALNFLSFQCHWPASQLSALYLILDLEHEGVQNAIQVFNLRRQTLRVLLVQSRRPSIPRPVPHVVFRADPRFMVSDISGRAIIDIMQCFDLATGLRLVETTIQTVVRYRTHSGAQDLSACLGTRIETGRPIQLTFPAGTGEVMYVVTTGGHVIIAARSGHQKDLPHPTLIGGHDPEALSAGLVFFRDGRIIRVFINASGHFKPNTLSSIEVSFAAFSRLPPEAFHPHFEGYRVFQHGHRDGVLVPGPMPGGGSAFAPFAICDGGDFPGSLDATQALMRTGQMRDTLLLTESFEVKIVSGILMKYLVALSPDPVLLALMDLGMRNQYARLLLAAAASPLNPQRAIATHPDFQLLIAAIRRRLAEFLR
ncbi:hypothetical protein SAMN05414139_04322 [Burkholderia sp. D7]|nr:hypothetical protein SAMN05414139_04322 [Burkholderia sp. D7]